jgi:hypothetical protein
MPRQLSFVCKLVRLVYLDRAQIHSIRLKSASEDTATEISIESKTKVGTSTIDCLVEVGLNFDDFLYTDSELIEPSESQITAAAGARGLRVIFRHERCVDQVRLQHDLVKFTPYRLPAALIGNSSLSNLSIFYGASQVPLEIDHQRNAIGTLLSTGGLTYLIAEGVNKPGVTTWYVDENGLPTERYDDIDKFLPNDLRMSGKRRQFKSRAGVTIFSNVRERLIESQMVEALFPEAITKAVSEFELELTTSYQKEVMKLNDRIRNAKLRRKVYYDGKFVGYRPSNELETVILLERFLNLTGNSLVPGAVFELLEYSAEGIDGICEFSPSPRSPKSMKTVEFEYHLRNFFQHGHDLHQVDLIICYSDDGIAWPFDHYGLKYVVDGEGPFLKIRTLSGDTSAHLFVLSKTVEEI